MCVCDPSSRTPWCGKPGCEMPEQFRTPKRLDVGAVLGCIQTTTVTLAGFHLADRNAFAGFNMGRLQQAILQAVEELAAKGG